MISLLDGGVVSMAELSRVHRRTLSEVGYAGEAAITDATAFTWSSAIPGLTPGLAASHFGLWWRGVEDSRTMIATLVRGVLDEMQYRIRLRAEATWKGSPPEASQTPAWRLEGIERVPWFVPSALIEEADNETEQALAFKNHHTGWAGKDDELTARAATATGGRCMYCGSNHALKPVLVFPIQLGGWRGESNLSVCCPICRDFSQRLGCQRWGAALLAKPEEAADVWWKAQKVANVIGVANLSKVAKPR